MTKNQWFAASFLIISGSMAFMLVFAYTGLLMYQISFQQDQFMEETHIAGVEVSEMNRVEAVNTLTEEVEAWEEETEYKLTWYEETVELPPEAVQILVEPTVDQTLGSPELSEADLLVSVDEATLRQAVQEFSFREDMDDAVDFDALSNALEEEAGTLPENGVVKEIRPYLLSFAAPEEGLVSEASRTLPEPELEGRLVEDRFEIESGTGFSVLNDLFDRAPQDVSEETLNVLGSVIFEAVAHTNFHVAERHQRHALLDSIPAGFDAFLEADRRDFRFFNPNDETYELEVRAEGGEVYAFIYGYEFPYEIDVTAEELEQVEADTRIAYTDSGGGMEASADGNPFAEEEAAAPQNGEAGLRVRTVRSYSVSGAEVPEGEEILAEDYYAPQHAVEVRSMEARTPEEPEEAPWDDFPWGEEDLNDQLDDEELDQWMGSGVQEAFEQWLDEGSPGTFSEWINGSDEEFDFENGEDFHPGDGGDSGWNGLEDDGFENGSDGVPGNGDFNGSGFPPQEDFSEDGFDFNGGSGDFNRGTTPGEGYGEDGFAPDSGTPDEDFPFGEGETEPAPGTGNGSAPGNNWNGSGPGDFGDTREENGGNNFHGGEGTSENEWNGSRMEEDRSENGGDRPGRGTENGAGRSESGETSPPDSENGTSPGSSKDETPSVKGEDK